MSKLNAGQKAIVTRAKGESVVLAGAGSGKTHTLIELIYKLHKVDKIPLKKLFICTFTNKASEELKTRLSKKLKLKSVDNLWIGTFHALANRYLKQAGYKFSIIQENEKSAYLHTLQEELELITPMKRLLEVIDYKRSRNCDWNTACIKKTRGREDEDFTNEVTELKAIYKAYKKIKADSNLVDFHDLLYLFLKYLKKDKKFKNKFSWLIIDEAQDNNSIQNKIADKFKAKNKIFIGDIKQSIYGFRGATPRIFRERVENSKLFELSINYRSSDKIINFVNNFLQVNTKFKDQTLQSVKTNRFLPEFYNCEKEGTPDEIANNILKDIKHGIPYGEIAVLARSVKGGLFNELQAVLKHHEIPFLVRGGYDLMSAEFVQKYLCLVKCVIEPNVISTMMALTIIKGIGGVKAKQLSNLSKTGYNALLGAKVPKASQSAINQFVSLMNCKEKPPQEILKKSLYFLKTNYLEYANKKTADKKTASIAKHIVPLILDAKTLKEGINSLLLNSETDEKINRVVISTIHRSKGLEWESVHIPKFQEGSIPMQLNNEEFCLAYTAITRPKTRLRMYAEMPMDTVENKYKNISFFIQFMLADEERRKTFIFHDKSDIYNGITPEWS